MTKRYCYFFFFFTLILFGQKDVNPEEAIYRAIDVFVANPNMQSLQKLSAAEANFWKNSKSKTKEEWLAIVVLNCNKAYYENQLGQTSSSIKSYEKAWQLYQKKKLQGYDIIEYCLKPLGNLYTILGDYDSAENTIKQYFFIVNTTPDYPDAAGQKFAAILNLSNVYQSSGKNNQAIELLENTLKTEKLSTIQKGVLSNNLGNAYLLSSKNILLIRNSDDKAEKAFNASIQYLKDEKNQSETLSNSYRNLASLYRQRQQFDVANRYFEEAEKLFLEIQNPPIRKKTKLYYDKAVLLFDQKKYRESDEQIKTILSILLPNYTTAKNTLPYTNDLYPETLLMDAIDLQAEIFLKQNKPKKALEAFELSFYIEDLLMNIMVYENAKIITQLRARNRTEKCISIYENLYFKEKKTSYLLRAFELAEKTKSGILKDYLATVKTASSEEKSLLRQLQNLNNEIVKEQQKGSLASIEIINKAIRKQNEVMLSLKKIQFEKDYLDAKKIDTEALLSKLEKQKAFMIYYFMGNEKMYFFTLEDQKIALNYINITHTAIPKIVQFIDYFNDSNSINNDISGYNKYGKIAYDVLKLPKKNNYKNLIIVPDGILNFVPFEALITEESNTINFAKMHYFLNDFNIAYNNSASFYLNSSSLSSNEKSILGVFPIFEDTNFELTYSKKELQSIRVNFQGKYLENSAATYANFKNNAAQYAILHLSTHASSGDIETPASIKFYDREILYSELYGLTIKPDLVVLSACETGIGKLYKAEGAMSIARGFQLAGAQNLLFSLWKVNDYTTAVFMDDFYQNIKNNQSYFEANANVKHDFLNNPDITNAKKSPYYWSAFVYYGTISPPEKPTNYIVYFLSFLGLIGLFLIFNRYRK
ncbi:CHAT domain-containing tetratricopeptide repeat protein [Flavobacterium sp. Fl-77]|uniref:CHAT domain-containing tetratricopeptide repeat protein n=1 Tax=Flavobacterium flavipigmentatum TaxID=2893884 RepID=A0AAJ2SES3_9FLAO|nr:MULTISPECIES: CHAT domain-containing tetratricopeptide repeat protein [unclassified Flavobacterium]MDX6181192.1 CHAT domain-containing tetratricopeptide repeat protein [Flavobacterium sp. Fl-33]MDX6184793.1 CHAT domain-containing tetratricopeptide repeat protein [Flavobacterium sp. Fl-77]UFH39890.1 CHAT domain-containing protein [Flavobacterium sp. F-70]